MRAIITAAALAALVSPAMASEKHTKICQGVVSVKDANGTVLVGQGDIYDDPCKATANSDAGRAILKGCGEGYRCTFKAEVTSGDRVIKIVGPMKRLHI